MAAALAARMRGVPYIVRPLGTLNAYGVTRRRPSLKWLSLRLVERHVLANAAAVHFTSQAEWEEAKVTGISMRGVVVPLGVSGPLATEISELPFAVNGDRKVILFLSRLDAKKNVEGLLRAYACVRERHPNTLLVIAGDGTPSYVAHLKYLAITLGVDDATIWTGHIEGAKKWGVLKRADIYVLPSFSENFGIAVAEALIVGRPCVIARGVAIAQMIAEAGAGLVTEPEPDDIAEKIDRLLDDAALRSDASRRAAVLAREFSPETMVARLMDVYGRVVATHAGKALSSESANH